MFSTLSQRTCLTVIPAVLAALLAAGGCTLYSDDSHARRHDDYRDPPPPVVVREEYRDRQPPPPVVIREEAPRFEVPRYSQIVAEGHQKIGFRVRDSGIVYVYDLHNGRRILSEHLRDGDRFVFDPDHNKAFINGKTVYDHDIDSHHVYRVYFDNEGRGGRYERD